MIGYSIVAVSAGTLFVGQALVQRWIDEDMLGFATVLLVVAYVPVVAFGFFLAFDSGSDGVEAALGSLWIVIPMLLGFHYAWTKRRDRPSERNQ